MPHLPLQTKLMTQDKTWIAEKCNNQITARFVSHIGYCDETHTWVEGQISWLKGTSATRYAAEVLEERTEDYCNSEVIVGRLALNPHSRSVLTSQLIVMCS